MANNTIPAARYSSARILITIGLLLLGTFVLAAGEASVRAVWPPLVALTVIILTRHALTGLLVGGLAGAILVQAGNPWTAYLSLFADHLVPNLQSSWKMGAVAFTLILGGFAAVLEAGGGFTALLQRLVSPGRQAGPRVEMAAGGLGLLCFFDGLANSMVVGRVSRSLADSSGVARAKLAYIVDSTSSAVACVAFISTWIAFQLTMIGEAYALAGRDVNPYLIFLQSLPYNFHSWFTLVLLFVAIRFQFHPGPMAGFVAAAKQKQTNSDTPSDPRVAVGNPGHPATALGPLAVLLVAFFVGFMALGDAAPGWPDSRARVVAALGSDAGPLVLVLAAVIATVVAVLVFPAGRGSRLATPVRAFGSGVGAMIGPVGILFAAWIMGSVMSALGTAELISGLLRDGDVLWLMPTFTFLTGAAISFATGTSWGTMGLLFPLAVPAPATLGGGDTLLSVVVAAVFSGAVFGDHCSPFSDTTIVSSISCGVEPHDHVRTQIPYALLAALVAVVVGFVPAGLGVSPFISLPIGAAVLVALPRLPFWAQKS
ncbi:MAG: Na+/H+ antiporter NhaC family protein [Candidatus Krumholzibacteria bacterium]|nr:Na+/H+ antiporter NhaC family protein [Candidatus Krumholzibacteria bacterium]